MWQYIFGDPANSQRDQVSIIFNTIARAHSSSSSAARKEAKDQLSWMIPFVKQSIAFYNKEFGENNKIPNFKAYEAGISKGESVLPK
jgi:hypothetical protein